MAAENEQNDDFYGVLGLKRECSAAELRIAYKKLAMKWHPDRWSASGNPKYLEEANKKFQTIHQAYSVLSDANKRFLYDVGVYDKDDDDDENGMGDFLNEMAVMMSQSKANENQNVTFEELQEMFEEIFHSDTGSSSCSAAPQTSSQDSCNKPYSVSNKRNSCGMSSSSFSIEANRFDEFRIGMENVGRTTAAGERIERWAQDSRRDGRKQKIFLGQDVSSNGHSGLNSVLM